MVTELKEKQEAQVTPASREETLERLNAIEQVLSELHSNPAIPEKDLQAIAQIMDPKIKESEQRTAQAIRESEQRTMQGASTLMESYFEPKFKLLFENQQTMMENLTPKSRVDELEEEVAFLRSMTRQHSREIEALKHA